MKRLMRVLLLVILLAAAVAVGGVWLKYQAFLSEPIELGETSLIFDVEPGASLRQVSEQLRVRGILDHPYLFMAMAYLSGQAKGIKVGEYEIPNGTTPPKLLALLTSGKVVQHAFTLVEGWTFGQVLAAVEKNQRVRKSLGDDPSAKMVMNSLGHPDENPEGRFFPDTYHFTKGSSDLDILRRAYETMKQVLAQEWKERDEGSPLQSPYEALILASIVEKETGLASERPTIAGVFVRRLHLGMKLQTDPTVIYGLGERFDGNITRSDLLQDTAYNTYVHLGLPPTPIAMPGRGAIHAALHPASGNSLFFVAKGDGSHQFSATLADHNKAVRRYQLNKP